MIFLKWFGGMIPRRGEQHLAKERIAETGIFPSPGAVPPRPVVDKGVYATDAQNTDLYSGELRPLIKPSLAHRFPRPGDSDFLTPLPPDPSEPVDPVLPPYPWCPPGTEDPDCLPPPTACVAVFLTTDLPTTIEATTGIPETLTVAVNADASPPVLYQWYEDGIAMGGETGPTLELDIDATMNGRRYTVLVQNPCGFEQSATTTLIVQVGYQCDSYIKAFESVVLGNGGYYFTGQEFFSIDGNDGPYLIYPDHAINSGIEAYADGPSHYPNSINAQFPDFCYGTKVWNMFNDVALFRATESTENRTYFENTLGAYTMGIIIDRIGGGSSDTTLMQQPYVFAVQGAPDMTRSAYLRWHDTTSMWNTRLRLVHQGYPAGGAQENFFSTERWDSAVPHLVVWSIDYNTAPNEVRSKVWVDGVLIFDAVTNPITIPSYWDANTFTPKYTATHGVQHWGSPGGIGDNAWSHFFTFPGEASQGEVDILYQAYLRNYSDFVP